MGEDPAQDGAERVDAELERSRYAEVATAATNRPEQILVVRFTRGEDLAGGGDDIGRDEVVDRQTVLAHEPPETAAESETGYSRARHLAACGGKTRGRRQRH